MCRHAGCSVWYIPDGLQICPARRLSSVFVPEHTGQLGVMSDVGPAPPQQPRRRKAPTLWQSSWAAASSLFLGICWLANVFGHPRGPWWLHLVFGVFLVMVGLVNLRSALKIRRNQRRIADSATADAKLRL